YRHAVQSDIIPDGQHVWPTSVPSSHDCLPGKVVLQYACPYEYPFCERGPFALCGLDWLTFLPGFEGATAQERLRMATKLLLVEDSFSIQTIVETIFIQEDFEVMVSGDALDGLHKAQTWLPDIVLADASMPGMDGFQLCQRLRQSASDHQVPVVLLTSGFTAY